MAQDERTGPRFEITHAEDPATHLVAGFSSFGLAGLTAVDYLTKSLDLEKQGHITSAELPAITPFENGTPRHHTRLYSRADLDLTVLVNELFVPPWAADAFSDAVLEWTDANGVEDLSILSGVPIPHGPEDHRTYYVATEDYQEKHLPDSDVPPMGRGFLDGVNASLVGRGMDTPLRVGVITTPVHAQAPDVEASLRLVNAVADLLEVEVDTADLEAFAENVQAYYEELAQRMERVEDEVVSDDRMFM